MRRGGTTPVETCAERSAAAFATAMAGLEGRYGTDWRSWRWGDAHPAVLAHRAVGGQPLLRRWFSRLLPVGGDDSTVDVAHAGRTRDELPFGVVHAAGYRAIYDLAAPDRSRWIAATGQSGHPLSRHYADLAGSWQQGRYLAMRWTPGPTLPVPWACSSCSRLRQMPPSCRESTILHPEATSFAHRPRTTGGI